MTARYATAEEIQKWDEFILSNPGGGNVFSSAVYARQKKMNGYKVQYVFVDSLAITVLEKQTPPFGRLWYLPKGPNVTSTKDLFDVIKKLTPLARKRHVFTIRIETELPRSSAPTLKRRGLIPASPIIPNPSTITLDLTQSTDDILLGLPQKGRHAIRRAERDGVTIQAVSANEKNCQKMYRLLRDTAEGQFGIRSYTYFKTFWKEFEKASMGQLFFASYEGKVVAGAFVLIYGTKSTYKDGASVRQRTAYGASHLLQWKAIEWAKSRGSLIHDFCGSPPSDEINNPDHPHYGIGLFKTSFSKTVVDYIGCYDVVISTPMYTAWKKGGERIYRGLYYRRTKDYYY